jgi:hypothetical protein
MTLNYRFLNRLQAGVEYNPVASEVSPLFNLFLFTETNIRPAVFLGTSSDRIGSPAGKQAYYLTVAKRLPSLPLSAYATVNYSEWDEGLNFPFGASVEFGKGFSARGMYDGDRSHLMFNYFYQQHGVSLMYIWIEKFGIAMSTAF